MDPHQMQFPGAQGWMPPHPGMAPPGMMPHGYGMEPFPGGPPMGGPPMSGPPMGPGMGGLPPGIHIPMPAPVVMPAPSKADLALPIQGNQKTANLDPILLENIQNAMTFKMLFDIKSFEEFLERAEETIEYLNAWGDQPLAHRRDAIYVIAPTTGAAHLSGIRGWVDLHHQASPCFCVIFKMHTFSPTIEQMEQVLRHDKPMIRAVGLTYLRLVLPPAKMWEWFEDHLSNKAELMITPKPHVKMMTVGEVALSLLTEMKFLDTRFPRINDNVKRNLYERLTGKGYGHLLPAMETACQRQIPEQRPAAKEDDAADGAEGTPKPKAAPRKRFGRGDMDMDDVREMKRKKEESKGPQPMANQKSPVPQRKDPPKPAPKPQAKQPERALPKEDPPAAFKPQTAFSMGSGKKDEKKDEKKDDRKDDRNDRKGSDRDRPSSGRARSPTGHRRESDRNSGRDRNGSKNDSRDSRDRHHSSSNSRRRTPSRERRGGGSGSRRRSPSPKDKSRNGKDKDKSDKDKDKDKDKDSDKDKEKEKEDPSGIDVALAKLRHVYGNVGGDSAVATSDGRQKAGKKNNTLGVATVTLGSRAWGKMAPPP